MEVIHDADDIISAYPECIEMEEHQNVLNHNKRSNIGNILELSPPLEESRTVLDHDDCYLVETAGDHLSSKNFQADLDPRQLEKKYQNWCPDSYQPFGLNHGETADPRQQMSRAITCLNQRTQSVVKQLTEQGHWIAAVQKSISVLAKGYDKISVLEAKMNKLQEERSRIYDEKRHTKHDS